MADLPNYTLDNNCLIALDNAVQGLCKREDEAGWARCCRKLVSEHDAGRVCLRLPGTLATERVRGGAAAVASWPTFEARTVRAGVSHLPVLEQPFVFGFSHWNHMRWMSPAHEALLADIHEAVFPGQPLVLAGGASSASGRWRRNTRDSAALWSHAVTDGDIFVTTDGKVIKAYAEGRLQRLVPGKVLSPSDAVREATGSNC